MLLMTSFRHWMRIVDEECCTLTDLSVTVLTLCSFEDRKPTLSETVLSRGVRGGSFTAITVRQRLQSSLRVMTNT